MNLPPNRVEILKVLRRYCVLTARQIRNRILAHDADVSITRAHLRKLVAAKLVRRYQPRILDPLGNGTTAPVYALTLKGASFLVAITGDSRWMLTAEVNFSNWMSVIAWCSVSSLAMQIDDAFAAQTDVRLLSMHFEHEVANPDAVAPSERYLLHTTVGDKLYFVPDFAVESEFRNHVRVNFGEYETGSDTPMRVANKKQKGIAAFGAGGHLAKLFPSARDHRVIFFCPNAGWRDQLREEFKKFREAREWTLFCATPDVTAASFLHEPILYSVDKGPLPFLPKAPGGSPVGEARAEMQAERK